MVEISSLQNPRIKQLVNLSKRRERDRCRRTVVEGMREISHALAAGIIPAEVYVCHELCNDESRALLAQLQALASKTDMLLCAVTPAVFAKIAYRGDSGGLLLTIPYIAQPLSDFSLSENPFLVVVEGVEKPGNLGAILRTADAVGVDGVIVCSGGTDLHNPNVIRASLGALFTVSIAEAESIEVLEWLQRANIQIVAADPMATRYHTDVKLDGPIAIVMGSEAYGLTAQWHKAAHVSVKIPMFGVVDSLNLSVATAVMLYEVLRQRLGVSP